jgi:hypothetical protein
MFVSKSCYLLIYHEPYKITISNQNKVEVEPPSTTKWSVMTMRMHELGVDMHSQYCESKIKYRNENQIPQCEIRERQNRSYCTYYMLIRCEALIISPHFHNYFVYSAFPKFYSAKIVWFHSIHGFHYEIWFYNTFVWQNLIFMFKKYKVISFRHLHVHWRVKCTILYCMVWSVHSWSVHVVSKADSENTSVRFTW